MSWGNVKKIRKYRPGATIDNIISMISAISYERKYVFIRGKPYNAEFLRNWSLASLEIACNYGGAFVAELTPEWVVAEAEKAEIAREKATAVESDFSEIGE
jgi:hypothetical protein